jgi:hypothetical protein
MVKIEIILDGSTRKNSTNFVNILLVNNYASNYYQFKNSQIN